MNDEDQGYARLGVPRSTGPLVGRRRFLTGAAASVVAITTGCSSSDDPKKATGATSSTTAGSATSTTLHSAKLSSDPFSLGVASGDPLADRVILWTRLAPDALAADGGGGMPAGAVDVVWEIALDERFAKMAATGVFTAEANHGHSVHVDAEGLDPATDHHYRFRVGDWTSPVGRTRTLADGSPERFSLAVANCQMFETGYYAAYRHMAQEDLDLVLHLGDYIYEYPGSAAARGSKPDRMVNSLSDYRLRYASYKVDPDLRAAHARFPFVVTWDDHDVANNYMGDVVPGTPDDEAKARKAAAYQAWWENLPVRLDAPDGVSDLAIYRDFTVGDLARLSVLDERQSSDLPPCRPDPQNSMDFGDCAARTEENRSRLGADQDKWLAKTLDKGGVTWNLLGNPVVLAGVDAGTDKADFYLDTWDGFPQARERLIAQLAAVENPVVLTGDYHQGMVLDVHAKPFDQGSAVVAPEFMAPPISSGLFGADVSRRTPQLREQLNKHGYLTVEATPEKLTAKFRVLDEVTDPKTAVRTASTWTVTAGDPVTKRV